MNFIILHTGYPVFPRYAGPTYPGQYPAIAKNPKNPISLFRLNLQQLATIINKSAASSWGTKKVVFTVKSQVNLGQA